MAKILVVDDDPKIRSSLRRTLAFDGYTVREAEDGREALTTMLDELPDLVLLDLMLPGIDGIEVARRLREMSDVPIVMVTARDGTSDQVTGLDAGADDYLVKPFIKDELLARIRAVLRRRTPGDKARQHQVADLVLDERAHLVTRGGRELDLTPREYELLLFFLRHPGEVLAQDRILAAIWGYTGSKVLDVYVGYLRTKMEAEGESRLIQTVRGVGYVLRPS
ncbi:MAG: response regulator transcription factor [Candidatus Dormiibacterota bacterium]